MESTSSDYITPFRVHSNILEAVQQHRAVFGITPRWQITKQLHKTKLYCKTVMAKELILNFKNKLYGTNY